jgi:hypothetical protein
MAIATVVVFWVPVEVLGRLDFFKEIWIEPEKYTTQMISILVAFVVLLGYIMIASKRRLTLNQVNNEENNLEKTT